MALGSRGNGKGHSGAMSKAMQGLLHKIIKDAAGGQSSKSGIDYCFDGTKLSASDNDNGLGYNRLIYRGDDKTSLNIGSLELNIKVLAEDRTSRVRYPEGQYFRIFDNVKLGKEIYDWILQSGGNIEWSIVSYQFIGAENVVRMYTSFDKMEDPNAFRLSIEGEFMDATNLVYYFNYHNHTDGYQSGREGDIITWQRVLNFYTLLKNIPTRMYVTPGNYIPLDWLTK